jgi:hypothetical protein
MIPTLLEILPIISILRGLGIIRKLVIVGLIILIIGVITIFFVANWQVFWQELFVPCHDFTKIQICYPTESLFLPHGATLLAICVIVFAFYVSIKWIGKKTNIPLPKTSDAISATGVIATILVLFLPFFVLNPILDYNIKVGKTSDNSIQLNTTVTNYGVASAKHLILSLQGNSNDFKFLQLTSEPIQSPIQLYDKHNQTDNAFFKIDSLPSRVESTIKANLSILGKSKPTLTAYLRSDETNGVHGFIYLFSLYLLPLVPLGVWVFNKFANRMRPKAAELKKNTSNGTRN